MEKRTSRAFSIAIAIASILLITLVLRVTAAGSAILNATTVGFAYLVAILLVAAWWGIVESVIASIVATISFNYFFLKPVGTWAIDDPENWVALFSFLMTSLIASELSNRARRRTLEANARKVEMERLYALSRAILTMDDTRPTGEQIAKEIARVWEISAVAIYDRVQDVVHHTETADLQGIEKQLREMVRSESRVTQEKDGMSFATITLGGEISGSVAMRGAEMSNAALHALINLIAITLENSRSRDVATRAKAARQSEEFKSTLLDGLAHEFKTPLTSIKAAASALLASNVSDVEQQHELLTVVDQEAERLSRLVTEATRVARIEAGQIQLNRRWSSLPTLIEKVLAQMETQCDGRRLEISNAPDLPAILVDSDLIQLALRQLIDNALKYSPRKSAIEISSRVNGDNVVITLRNGGEPLSQSERARIFDKFYRGQNVRHQVAGTGLGLPVARDILVAHGGDVQLRGSDANGTQFEVTIPALSATSGARTV